MDPRLSRFLEPIMEDPQITAVHISLYLALLYQWYERGSRDPLHVYSWEVMPKCKISGLATYHRCIRDLDAYGYIRYMPSYNHYRGSRVYMKTLTTAHCPKGHLPEHAGRFRTAIKAANVPHWPMPKKDHCKPLLCH